MRADVSGPTQYATSVYVTVLACRDRAEFFPDAALQQRSSHIESQMKSLGRLVHKANQFREIIVDGRVVRGEIQFRKAFREIRLQLVTVVSK